MPDPVVICSIKRGLTALLLLSGVMVPTESSAQSGTVVVESSRAYVFVGKKGVGREHGVEGRVSAGEIHLDRAEQVGRLVFDL